MAVSHIGDCWSGTHISILAGRAPALMLPLLEVSGSLAHVRSLIYSPLHFVRSKSLQRKSDFFLNSSLLAKKNLTCLEWQIANLFRFTTV